MNLHLRGVRTMGAEGLREVSITDGRIAAQPAADAERVDLAGRWLLPGFCDAHLHVDHAACERAMVSIPPATETLAELRRLLPARAEDGASDWILAAGWSSHLEPALTPTPAAALEEVAAGRPLFAFSADRHRALLNRTGLAHLGLAGEGLLLERELDPVWRRVPRPDGSLESECERLLRAGITAVGTFDGIDSLRRFESLDRRGSLALRISHSIPWEQLLNSADEGWDPAPGLPRRRLQVRWVKVFLDGTLGSHTAWMFEDYDDRPGWRGIRRISRDELAAGAERLAARRLAVAVHAIGDCAVETARRWIADLPAPADGWGPHRIEHAQLIAEDTLHALARRAVALSLQPCHLLEDLAVAGSRWGERCRGLIPLASLARAGVPFCLGSDHPIETFDPWVGLRSAVDRRPRDESAIPPPGVDAECIDFEAAFRAATAAAAPLNGLPSGWGTLAIGAPADLQILETELPLHCIGSLSDAAVAAVLVSGVVVAGALPS